MHDYRHLSNYSYSFIVSIPCGKSLDKPKQHARSRFVYSPLPISTQIEQILKLNIIDATTIMEQSLNTHTSIYRQVGTYLLQSLFFVSEISGCITP